MVVEGEDLRGPTAARTATAAAAVSAVEGTPSEGCTELVLRYTIIGPCSRHKVCNLASWGYFTACQPAEGI